jgi:SIR2-like domain
MPEHPLKSALAEQPQLSVWLTYLWQRREEAKRVGLVLGAGATRDAGCPMWRELVRRLCKSFNISQHRMRRHRDAGLSETFIAEVASRYHSSKHKRVELPLRSVVVDASWRKEVHKCLYKGLVTKKLSEITKKHRYIKPLAELICKAGFAVTFNFDDIVDEAVTEYAAAKGLPNPEIINRPKLETRKDAAVIYHINGVLPREALRKASEKIILTEDAFADVLLSPNSLDAQFVINQFAVKTFLLLGVSVSDNSLKNLLRAAVNRNPANHHFIVIHEKEGALRPAEARKDIFEVNLHVYNLISIFLTTNQIKAFLEILNVSSGDEFEAIMSTIVSTKIDRKYYLVGTIAAGKTSTLEALRCFQTFEEWSGRVPRAMYLNDKKLSKEQQRVVDDFVFPQLISKTNKMARQAPGIRVMDRAFLDLFAFSKGRNEISRKAKELRRRFREMGKHFEDGHIFFLTVSHDALKARMARRGIDITKTNQKGFDSDTLLDQLACTRFG